MKIRNGFVSNSSSSSFVISKATLSEVQLLIIRNHIETAKFLMGLDEELLDPLTVDIEWVISEDDQSISGNTCMDNFDLGWLLDQIGVPAHTITWRKQ